MNIFVRLFFTNFDVDYLNNSASKNLIQFLAMKDHPSRTSVYRWCGEFKRRLFACKCFVCEQLLLDLAHLETPIPSTAAYFRAHTRKSTIYHRRVSKHRDRIFRGFLASNRHETFFERLTNCVGSNANKFF